jgi:hypothetical protein
VKRACSSLPGSSPPARAVPVCSAGCEHGCEHQRTVVAHVKGFTFFCYFVGTSCRFSRLAHWYTVLGSGVMRRACPIALLLVITACQALKSENHFDEFEGLGSFTDRIEDTKPQAVRPRPASSMSFQVHAQDHYWLEIAALVYFILYAINFFSGRRANEALALAWAKEYCQEGRVLPRNFSLLGPGYSDNQQEMLMKQSNSQFQLWASGRRCVLFRRTSMQGQVGLSPHLTRTQGRRMKLLKWIIIVIQ